MLKEGAYGSVVFTLRHGGWYAEGTQRSMDDVLQEFGEIGLRLVSLNIEEYEYDDQIKQVSGFQEHQYSFQTMRAVKQRAVFQT